MTNSTLVVLGFLQHVSTSQLFLFELPQLNVELQTPEGIDTFIPDSLPE